MKQSKSTLILGVMLAILVVVLLAFEINTGSQPSTPNNVEESVVVPIAKKTISLFRNIIAFGVSK